MWKHFFDGFNLIHGILLAIAAVASFRFWARTRFRFPTYVHVLAVIGSIAILTVFWAEPEELREKISVVRMLVGALIVQRSFISSSSFTAVRVPPSIADFPIVHPVPFARVLSESSLKTLGTRKHHLSSPNPLVQSAGENLPNRPMSR